MPVDFILIYI